MNWLARFSKGPAALPAESQHFETRVLDSESFAFDGTIKHGQWKRRGGTGEIIEDAFINPDPTHRSPHFWSLVL